MANCNIKPLGDRVLLEICENTEVMKGGILIPDSAKEKPQEYRVVALGTGKNDDKGNKIPFDVKEGDIVLTSRYGGTEVKVGDKVVVGKFTGNEITPEKLAEAIRILNAKRAALARVHRYGQYGRCGSAQAPGLPESARHRDLRRRLPVSRGGEETVSGRARLPRRVRDDGGRRGQDRFRERVYARPYACAVYC